MEQTSEDSRSLRYRVNVSTTSKGVKTWDCTVEGTGWDMGDILDLSDLLVRELQERYPAPTGA